MFTPPTQVWSIFAWAALILALVFGLTRLWGWLFDKPGGPFTRQDEP